MIFTSFFFTIIFNIFIFLSFIGYAAKVLSPSKNDYTFWLQVMIPIYMILMIIQYFIDSKALSEPFIINKT